MFSAGVRTGAVPVVPMIAQAFRVSSKCFPWAGGGTVPFAGAMIAQPSPASSKCFPQRPHKKSRSHMRRGRRPRRPGGKTPRSSLLIGGYEASGIRAVGAPAPTGAFFDTMKPPPGWAAAGVHFFQKGFFFWGAGAGFSFFAAQIRAAAVKLSLSEGTRVWRIFSIRRIQSLGLSASLRHFSISSS